MSQQDFFKFFLVSESQDKTQVIFQAEIFLIELGPRRCPKCPKAYTTLRALKNHATSHAEKTKVAAAPFVIDVVAPTGIG